MKINFDLLDKKKINLINVDFQFSKIFDKISNKSNSYINQSFNIALKILKENRCAGLINGPVSKKNFLKGRKFPNLKTKEDYVLWLKITFNNNKIFALKDNLTKWRKLEDSLSSSRLQKIYDGYLVYRKYMNFNLLKSFGFLMLLSFNYFLKDIKNK